ncbi:TIGR01777 family oxidoreductase [Amphritea sp. 1_MG-2023]|uniref:TIGR01777 family oxidoreductase n=1 Tax=Amphritea sp. 1_MG-2023 TaxID=3062670 RepID=UPI0026E32117|nr:TIGR01777 family oxidoreductase [Amphritea sp. 1_MG-2023]MDO6562240.1 TIGR01777 family oxidoreductase [Amphritea sp. 1_MG-2023]
MKVLITGATGFIGGHLVARLLKDGHELIVMTRSAAHARKKFAATVAVITHTDQINSDEPIDAIINLAGAGIADQRWSESRKQLLVESRLTITAQLIALMTRLVSKPEVFISGSAIGYYGCRSDDLQLDERSDTLNDFTHDLCQRWESEALKAQTMGVRVCLLRTGIVLGQGGALAKMLLAFRLGLGGPIAGGDQWMSWIHINDDIEIICLMLTQSQYCGAYNLTAPEAVTNEQFSRTLAKTLCRPAWFRLPAGVLKLMLGEGSDLLLKGQRVYPKRLLDADYQFIYPELAAALKQVLK